MQPTDATVWQTLIERLQDVSVCQISDALGSSCPVETNIPPLHPEFRICGVATTVKCAPDDNLTLHHALHMAELGQVLAVDGGGAHGAALWGELMSLSAHSRGLAGTIMDAAARDRNEIAAIGYPVFARHCVPYRASKEKYGKLNVPIQCGCLRIEPGDLIVADINGIVGISLSRLEKIVQRALEVVRKEEEMSRQIDSGRTIFEVLRLENAIP